VRRPQNTQFENRIRRLGRGPKGRGDKSLGWSEAEAQEWFFVRERALKARPDKGVTVGIERSPGDDILTRFQRWSAFF
jgi:hypothetical protein